MSKNSWFLPIVLSIGICLGIFLWCISDSPPYSTPSYDLNKGYWGLIVDIAHKWREGQLSFWDRGAGGGNSLFLSGQYPILSTVNIGAFLLNDDHFFLFNLIIPYVIGFILCVLLFVRIFSMSLVYAFFGSLLYLGLLCGKNLYVAQSPALMWGAVLFPAMIYAHLRWENRNMYWAAMLVGSLVSVQFGFEGTVQVPHLTIWWMIFFFVRAVGLLYQGFWRQSLRSWILCSLLFLVMAIGLWGIQLIPSLDFISSQNIRAGYYPINSFPLFGFNTADSSLQETLVRAFLTARGISGHGVLILVLLALALLIAKPRVTIKGFSHPSFFLQMWVSTAVFLSLPTVAEFLVSYVPLLDKVFSPLRMFNIRYAIYIFDFAVALTLCSVLNNKNLNIMGKLFSVQKGVVWLLMGSAFVLGIIPALFFVTPLHEKLNSFGPFWASFEPYTHCGAFLSLCISTIVLWQVALRPKDRMLFGISATVLMFLGLMCVISSFRWEGKGKQDASLPQYYLNTPEGDYFRSARGQYFIPFLEEHPEKDLSQWVKNPNPPSFVGCNFGLLYGVHSSMAFLSVHNIRYSNLIRHYRSKNDRLCNRFDLSTPSPTFATYFPIDFTFTLRDVVLPWKGFSKRVEGFDYDVWVSEHPSARVRFARKMVCLEVEDMVKTFDLKPFQDTIYVEQQDCRNFRIESQQLPDSTKEVPQVMNFIQTRGDVLRFDIMTPAETWVYVPEMFQRGWDVRIDGKKVKFFPAQYLFIGFHVPAGTHSVYMQFSPPKLMLGFVASLLSLLILWLTYRQILKRSV